MSGWVELNSNITSLSYSEKENRESGRSGLRSLIFNIINRCVNDRGNNHGKVNPRLSVFINLEFDLVSCYLLFLDFLVLITPLFRFQLGCIGAESEPIWILSPTSV